jgi:type IV pilus assembly protein PilC
VHSFFIRTIFPQKESETVGFQIEGIPAYERSALEWSCEIEQTGRGILVALLIIVFIEMITFAYQARDASGRIVSGIQDALNEDNAVTSLMSRGLMVLSLQQKAVASKTRKKIWTVKETDLVLFTRQLATMIEAGISLVQGLTALYDQSDPKRQRNLRHVVSDVTTRVQGGETFHEAVAKHPRVFNRLFVSMVKAGETGGLLAEILERLAGFLEASARLRKKVKSAMTYPVIVICIALLITTFLIVRVVPIFGEIFKDFGAKLPAPTQFLIDVSDFVRGEWYFLLIGIASIVFGTRTFLRSTRGKQIWDRLKLKLPVFGPLIHKIAMSRFARTFAQLIRSGVPILEVIDIVGGSAGNDVIEKGIKSVGEDVEKGDNLSVAMSKKSIFPPMLLRMVAAGEATGKIDTMLEKMADFWDEEIEAMLDALTSLIEPMLIVFLGVIVGGIVIAMFLPIFKLNEVVSQNQSAH